MTPLNTLLTRKRELYPDIDIDRIAALVRNEFFNTIYHVTPRSDFASLTWLLERGVMLIEFEQPENVWMLSGNCTLPSYRIVTDYEYHNGVFTDLDFLKSHPHYGVMDVYGKITCYSPRQDTMLLIKGFMWGYLAPGLHQRIAKEIGTHAGSIGAVREIVSDMTEILNDQQREEQSLREQCSGRIS